MTNLTKLDSMMMTIVDLEAAEDVVACGVVVEVKVGFR